MLIGVTGAAGAGKDTLAGLITGMVPESTVYHFAGPVKTMALAIDPWVEIGKNPDDSLHVSRLSHVVAKYGWTVAKQLPEVRRFLQRLGTEGARETFGDNCWVDLMRDHYYELEPSATLVVPDTRFPNEANAIYEEGGKIIKVVRPNSYDLGDNATHASERGIDSDYIIHNDGDIGALELKVWGVLEEMGHAWP